MNDTGIPNRLSSPFQAQAHSPMLCLYPEAQLGMLPPSRTHLGGRSPDAPKNSLAIQSDKRTPKPHMLMLYGKERRSRPLTPPPLLLTTTSLLLLRHLPYRARTNKANTLLFPSTEASPNRGRPSRRTSCLG